MRVLATILVAVVFMAIPARICSEQATPTPSSKALKSFLRSYMSEGRKIVPDETRINVATTKMHDGKSGEIIVYLSGDGWCGSGGCTMLILEPAGLTFKVLGRVTVVELPITLLPSMHNGPPDIEVAVHGSGAQPSYNAVLSFDGKRYPGNPSVPPARKAAHVKGKVVVSTTDDSVPLYD